MTGPAQPDRGQQAAIAASIYGVNPDAAQNLPLPADLNGAAPAAWQASQPGLSQCKCGRIAQGGYCGRCFLPAAQCPCTPVADIRARLTPGSCVLDEPATPPALWGRGPQVLAASGESTIICGPDGVGKTTLEGMLIRAQLGLGPGEPGQPREVLGYPVALLPPGQRILLLAMDRPRQAMRSLARLFTEAERRVLWERLVVWKGPPPADLAADPAQLAEMCQLAGAGICYLDSLKDAALGLSEDRTGAAWNRARQMAISGGTELFELHHPRKASGDNPKPRAIEDVYGSRWIPAGAGSVIFLWGKPGDAVVELYHRKQPAEEIPSLRMVIDPETGMVHAEGGDIIGAIVAQGTTDFTAYTVAQLMSGTLTPDRNAVEKARRALKRMEGEGRVIAISAGGRGTGNQATWRLPPELAAQAIANGPRSPWQMLYDMAEFRAS